MSLKLRSWLTMSYGSVLLGILLGAFGIVRVGSVLIALGTAGVAISRKSTRMLERYLPLAISAGLLVLAIALPHGR
ncbi:MAG: hypothetical protein WCK72_02575 [Actinomycetes bacterium]|nr:hypothetical protein [Actinomycetota bacterium]